MREPFTMNIQLFAEPVTTGAETNVITTQQMSKAREVDFVERFTHASLDKLIEMLGVTRKIAMIDGTTMYYYKTTGTLEDGAVPEGEIIPLSRYQRDKYPIGEITLHKWRKASTAEAILKSGYDEAVNATDAKLMSDAQNGIRTSFIDSLKAIDATVVGGATLQAVLAKTWGQIQVLFENDSADIVHFMNPLTIADYLSTATITVQTAFGFNYIQNFLGMGTVILHSQIPVGQVYSTAKENIIMYYVPVTSEVMSAFDMTADATGYIGIASGVKTHERAQIESLVMCGIQFLVEYADGVVLGQVDSTPTLGSITVASTAGTAVGDSNIAVSGYNPGTGEKYVYKTGKTTAPAVTYGQKLGTGWTAIVPPHDITPTATHDKITVASVDANGRAQAAGTDDITVKTA